jgi:uncharacterized FlaG/YvyC family protein
MNQISSPADRVKIKKMLGEISNSMTRIAAERDLIRETIAELSKEFELPKKYLNRMAKVYHKQNFQIEQANHEEFEDLYVSIVESNT